MSSKAYTQLAAILSMPGMKDKPGRSDENTIASWDEEKREFSVNAVHGGQLWPRIAFNSQGEMVQYNETLHVTTDACVADRAQNSMPFVMDHSHSVKDTVGVTVPGSWSVNDALAVATHRIRAASMDGLSEEGKQALANIRDGILCHTSLEYEKLETELVDNGEGQPPTLHVLKWRPVHDSIVSVGADDSATTLSASPVTAGVFPNNEKGAKRMNPDEKAEVGGAAVAPGETNTKLSAQNVELAERARLAEYRLAISDRATLLRLDEPAVKEIRDNTKLSLTDGLEKLIELKAAKEVQINTVSAAISSDAGDKNFEAMTTALEMKMGIPKTPKELEGNPFVMLKATQLAAESLKLAGYKNIPNSEDAILTEVRRNHLVNPFDRYSRNAQPAADFPYLLENIPIKLLQKAYEELKPTYREWSQQQNLPNFKPSSVVQISGVPELQKWSPNAAAEYINLGERGEHWQIYKLLIGLELTDESLVDDDLTAFGRNVMALGNACIRTEQSIAVRGLTSNQMMEDGYRLFSAQHRNLMSGAVLGPDSLGAMEAMIGDQVGLKGEVLDINLKSLLFSTLTKQKFEAMISTHRLQTSLSESVADWVYELNYNKEPRISRDFKTGDGAYDHSGYIYGFADPANATIAVYGYLATRPGPMVRSEIEFKSRNLNMVCDLCFGHHYTDYHAVCLNPYIAQA